MSKQMENQLNSGNVPPAKRLEDLANHDIEALYRVIIQTSPDGILIADVQGRISFASQSCLQMLELEHLDQVTGTFVVDWVETEDQSKVIQHIADALAGNFAAHPQYHLRTRLGNSWIGEVNAALLQDAAGHTAGFVAIIRDVTEQWQAGEALRRSEEKFRNIVQASPVGLHFYRLEKDQRLILEDANPAADQILGISHAQLIGKTIEEAFPGLVETEIPATYRRLAAQGGQWRDDQVSYDWEQVRGAFAVVAFQSNPGHMVATFQDITERKQAEQALRTSLAHVQLLRTIDQLMIQHEDLQATASSVLPPILEYYHADAAEILLYMPGPQTFQQIAGIGFLSDQYRLPMPSFDGMPGLALQTRMPVALPDLRSGHILIGNPKFLQQEQFISGYSVLLATPNRVQGVLQLFYRTKTPLPAERITFLEVIADQVAIGMEKASLWERHQQALQELETAYATTLEGWVYALDMRDQETEHHTRRVTELTMIVAKAMGIPEEALGDLQRGALLHDIGKIGIPDSVLRKAGPLTEAEWAVMRKHPVLAQQMLLPISYLHGAIAIPHCHHERWDGSGYPQGLKGEEIPLAARIFAVVDVWDALRSDRPYRSAWSAEKAMQYLRNNAGVQFDPEVVRVFFQVMEHLPPVPPEASGA